MNILCGSTTLWQTKKLQVCFIGRMLIALYQQPKVRIEAGSGHQQTQTTHCCVLPLADTLKNSSIKIQPEIA